MVFTHKSTIKKDTFIVSKNGDGDTIDEDEEEDLNPLFHFDVEASGLHHYVDHPKSCLSKDKVR
jgi:hypothetical protein